MGLIVRASCLAAATGVGAFTAPVLPTSSPVVSRTTASPVASALDRRAVLGGLLGVTAMPLAASAQIESTNPANNYYFPMAKYRYLPRIFRAWIAADQLGPAALEAQDWEGLKIVYERLDDATTAMPLYTSAVEGSRSTKRKKKSDAQKTMMARQKMYTKAVEDLNTAATKKNAAKARIALQEARDALQEYRVMAQIDKEDGGVIQLPLGNAEEAGHAGAPLGYVVPAFRGGGVSMDYALRAGEPMMENGVIRKDYRAKYQDEAKVEADGASKKRK
jgi:hypothetical protein